MSNNASTASLDATAPQTGLGAQLARSVANAPLQTQPFEYIYMENVFTPQFYREMQAQMPDKRVFHELQHKDALRPDGTSTRLRLWLWPELLGRLPAKQRAVWSEVTHALLSRDLQEVFLQKFAQSLEKRFKRPAHTLSFFPVPILLCDLPGYQIRIHSDVTSKAITVQFYLPADASRKHLGTVFHDGREGEAYLRTRTLPYVPASGYAFPVMPTASWHSVPQTSAADGDRYSLMVTYYVQDTAGGWIKRRYQRLRCFFGVGPKG
jgi:hypothetical protein